MKKYLEYKNEIQGFSDVLETVKTTEKIAASHINFLKKRVESLKLYRTEIKKMISQLLYYSKKEHPFLFQRFSGKKALMIITGNKGLVGDLYHNLINLLLAKQKEYQAFITVGSKAEDYLNEENIETVKSFLDSFSTLQLGEDKTITDYIFYEFQKGTFRQIDFLYSQFITLTQYQPTIVQFLPFKFNLETDNLKQEIFTKMDLGFPIFEPSKKIVFDQLLKKYIKLFFYNIVMEAKLSEFSARTVATEQAAVKTKEFIEKLRRSYLKEQHRDLTQKQIETFIVHHIKNL